VNSETLNAFTTGGEHMYIYTGLFRQCKSEDELAAVMAHEFAHIYGRHVQKGMNRQMGLAGAALVAGGAGYAAGGAEQGGTYASALAGAAAMAGSFVGKSFTRRDENEADKYGFIFYTRAGWDPEKFDDFFQTMIDKGYDKTPAIASDHPTLASRVQATQRRIGELPRDAGRWARPPVASGAEFQRLQQRAAEVGQRMPDDQSLARSQQLLGALPRSCFTAQDGHIPDQRQSQQRLLEDLQREQAARQRQQQAAQPQQQTTRQQTTTRQQVRRRQG
jgi:predicted Zn-dependent protease